jgi:SPP1 family predicted phage head-tail adaptor
MLRHTVELQSPSRTKDDGGGAATTWSTFATQPAYFKALSGGERYVYERLEANQLFRCVIRYRDDVGAEDRILFRSQPFQIRRVTNVEFRDRWLELIVEEGVAA